MKTDERDERLAGLLDRAVAPIDTDTEQRLREIRHRGARRRAVEVISALTAIAVFVGAVTVTALAIRGHSEGPGHDRMAWTAAGGHDAGWSLRSPSSWHIHMLDERQCSSNPVHLGALISSVSFRWRHPDGTTGGCFGHRWVFAGFPRNGIAIQIEPMGVRTGPIQPPQPDTSFPIRRGDLQATGAIRGGPAYSFLTVWRHGEELIFVGLYVGARASRPDLALAERTLQSLRLIPPPVSASKPTPSAGTRSRCLSAPQAGEVALPQIGDPLLGDVDGDGINDRVVLLYDARAAFSRCRYFLEVSKKGMHSVAPVVAVEAEPPTLVGLAHLDADSSPKVIVHLASGASSDFYAAFTWIPGGRLPLSQVRFRSRSELASGWRHLFESGASVGAGASGVSCGSGYVILTSTGRESGLVSIRRDFYRLDGRMLIQQPALTEAFRLSRREFIHRFAVLANSGQTFVRCGLIPA